MRNRIFLIILLLSILSCQKSNNEDKSASNLRGELYQLALSDLHAFAEKVTETNNTTYDQTKSIITWYAKNFDWTATDYKKRTVQEILERKGGNCNELAMVTTATLKALGIKMRKVREVNIHAEDLGRQTRAEAKVIENGFRASVFGGHHNDHVWIEILEENTGNWFPADPSLGIAGETEWLEARLGFGERFTLDPTSKAMIAPFAIFAYNDENIIIENRSEHYIIKGFNDLYSKNLETLNSWKDWIRLIDELDDNVQLAFEGKANLHKYNELIINLKRTYIKLSEEYKIRYTN